MDGFLDTTDPDVRKARTLALEYLAPRAQHADQSSAPPADQIGKLAAAGLLGLTVPVHYGGRGASAAVLRDCLSAIASGCGVTAFCYLQHVGGCRRIGASSNEDLKENCLRDFATGRRFLSLAHSHLRRPGAPVLWVTETGGQYVFNGSAPWMTGWGLATDVLLAGTLPDGGSVWVVAPLAEQTGLAATAPMKLCAVNASATVSLVCNELRIRPEFCVGTMTATAVAEESVGAVLTFCALSLGVALGAIDFLEKREQLDRNNHLRAVLEALRAEAQAMHTAVSGAVATLSHLEEVVSIRARCIDLGIRAAHATVVAAAGTANLLDHPAQRLFREAMLYTLTAQIQELRRSSLDLIAGQSRSACR